MSAAARLPVVVPKNRTVAGVHRPGIVRRGNIDHPINHQDPGADPGSTAGVQITVAKPAHDDRRGCPTTPPPAKSTSEPRIADACGTTARGQPRYPRQA